MDTYAPKQSLTLIQPGLRTSSHLLFESLNSWHELRKGASALWPSDPANNRGLIKPNKRVASDANNSISMYVHVCIYVYI